MRSRAVNPETHYAPAQCRESNTTFLVRLGYAGVCDQGCSRIGEQSGAGSPGPEPFDQVAAASLVFGIAPEVTKNVTMNSICEERNIVGMKVNATSYNHACEAICTWARQCVSKYVCVATVNNVMEAYDSASFQQVMNDADLVTPDGMPLVWALRSLGCKEATRVYGPDLTPLVLEKAECNGISVGFYGSSPDTLERLMKVLGQRFPGLQIAYSYSPPFRPLTPEEDDEVIAEINRSGARILFIGLNTPKQDYWMAAHKGSVQAVMVGVGAAFDFIAGTKAQAPRWMMRMGLEWVFRLATEPRRLWKRYLKHNPRFVGLFVFQLLGSKARQLRAGV